MTGHVIICGYGRVGRAAAEFLAASGHQVVVVDNEAARLEQPQPRASTYHLCGDVTDDDVLRQARASIGHAPSSPPSTRTPTPSTCTLSARAIRPDLVIIARARTTDAKAKMLLAGASRAINPQRIGGRRMAVFALQPDVAEFLDVVMHDEDLDFRIEQVQVGEGSSLVGRSLGELARPGTDRAPSCSPSAEAPGSRSSLIRRQTWWCLPGAVLIALGTPDELDEISRLGT